MTDWKNEGWGIEDCYPDTECKCGGEKCDRCREPQPPVMPDPAGYTIEEE